MDEKLIRSFWELGKSVLQFGFAVAALGFNTGRAVLNLLGRVLGGGGGSSGQSAPPEQQGASQSSPEGQRQGSEGKRQGSGKSLKASFQELVLALKDMIKAATNLGMVLGAAGKALWNGTAALFSKNEQQKPTRAAAPPATQMTPSQGSSISNDGLQPSQAAALQQTHLTPSPLSPVPPFRDTLLSQTLRADPSPASQMPPSQGPNISNNGLNPPQTPTSRPTLPPLSIGTSRPITSPLSPVSTLADTSVSQPPPETPGVSLRRANNFPQQRVPRPVEGSYDGSPGQKQVKEQRLELSKRRSHGHGM